MFDTREVRVWNGDRLVAFSWFDLGRESVQSLIGVYEPSMARQSLGFYTMLLEVQHALEQGLRFHYPGYVLPGDPAMLSTKWKLQRAAKQYKAALATGDELIGTTPFSPSRLPPCWSRWPRGSPLT